jgi:hypothetical protein
MLLCNEVTVTLPTTAGTETFQSEPRSKTLQICDQLIAEGFPYILIAKYQQ